MATAVALLQQKKYTNTSLCFSSLASDLMKLCGETRPRSKVLYWACKSLFISTATYVMLLKPNTILMSYFNFIWNNSKKVHWLVSQLNIEPNNCLPSGSQTDHHPDGASVCRQWGSVLWFPHRRLPRPSAAPLRAPGRVGRHAGSSARSNPWLRTNCFPICTVCQASWLVSVSGQHFSLVDGYLKKIVFVWSVYLVEEVIIPLFYRLLEIYSFISYCPQLWITVTHRYREKATWPLAPQPKAGARERSHGDAHPSTHTHRPARHRGGQS